VPGYPLLLALAFALKIASPEHLGGAILLQVLVSSITVVLAARVAFMIAGAGAAWIAGLLTILEPSSLSYTNLVMSETLYAMGVTVVAVAFGDWVRRENAASLLWCGLVVGFLSLVRPVALYLGVPMALLVYAAPTVGTSRARTAALFLALAVLPSCLWSYRNQHYFGLLTFDRNNALDKAIFARSVDETAGALPVESTIKEPWQAYFGEDQGLSQIESMGLQETYFRTVMKAHPWVALKRVALTAASLIGVPDSYLVLQITGRENSFEEGTVRGRLRWMAGVGPLAALLAIGMLISIGSIVSGSLLLMGSRRRDRTRTACLVCAMLLIAYHVALGGTQWHQGERHRVPIVPLMGAVLAAGLVEFRIFSKGRRDPVRRPERP